MKRITLSFMTLTLFCSSQIVWAQSFSEIYQQALTFEPKTRSAQYQAQSAKTRIRQAQAGLYPTVQFSANYSRNRYEYNPKYANKKMEQGLYSFTLQVNQNLYDPRVNAGIQVEKARSQIRQWQYKSQALGLAQDALQAYLEVIRSQQKIKLLQTFVDLNQSKLQKAEKQYALHLSSKVDVLQAQVDLDNAQIDLKKQKGIHQTNLVKLRKYIGETPLHLPRIANHNVLKTVKAMQAFIEHQAQDIQTNPQIQYAKANITSAQAQIQQAKSDYWPKTNLTASYSHYSTDTPNNENSYDNVSRVGINLTLPIYSGGQTSAQVDGAQLLKKSAQADLKNAQNTLKAQWSEAKTTFDSAVNMLPMTLHAQQAAQLYLTAQQTKFQKGLASMIDVNDALNKLQQTQFKYIDNMTNLTQAYITLLVTTNQIQGLKLADKILGK